MSESMTLKEAPQTSAQLCSFIAGVSFDVLAEDRTVRGLILAEALQMHFGATSDSATWLPSFERHRQTIVRRALSRRRGIAEPVVVLRPNDFD